MYDSGPSDAELAAIGITRDDVTDRSVTDIWPENWVPFQVFAEVSSQWEVGANGPVGLKYSEVRWAMKLHKIPEKRKLKVLRAIRVMESSAIRTMTA